MIRILCFNLLLLSFFSNAQDFKHEVEIRIKPAQKEVLKEPYERLTTLGIEARWFIEITNGVISYEAKFRWKGKRYSIEFDENGTLHEIDINISRRNLSTDLQRIIKNELNKKFRNFSFRNIQIQWQGNADDLWKILEQDALEPHALKSLTKSYELEIRGRLKSENIRKLYEVIISDVGQIESIREIVERLPENIIFG